MREAYSLVWSVLVLLFRLRVSLEAEILILRHQLDIQRRHLPKRLAFSAMDRLIFVGLYRLAPNTIKALTIVKPDTVIRWHRAGFRLYWRWKSRRRCCRPTVPLEIRRLIREMSIANPLWGAPRIHGELLKLGIEIGQTSVAKYMAQRRAPPSQGWKTFLRNHAEGSTQWTETGREIMVARDPIVTARPAMIAFAPKRWWAYAGVTWIVMPNALKPRKVADQSRQYGTGPSL
jgi:hypothetical protein